MPYQVRVEQQPTAAGRDGRVFVLESPDEAGRAAIWPGLGFNCYQWRVQHGSRQLDLIHSESDLFQGGSPTRSGIPILFPFPNRIAAGRFTWQGKEYSLPLNDSARQSAIHGFVCRRPWRVVEQGASGDEAWLSGVFHGSVDAPEVAALWPADYVLRLTYRLRADRLRLEAFVENPDHLALPFGLGYHPYFHLPLCNEGNARDCRVAVPARSYWELENFLPTGRRHPVDGRLELTSPRPVDELQLDDVLTDLTVQVDPGTDNLCLRGQILDAAGGHGLTLLASPAFREVVVFTPSHRQALCLEPYTCTTDAVNLEKEGVDAGWLALPAGGVWTGVVELRVS